MINILLRSFSKSNILARSNVFEKMFQQDTVEDLKNKFDLKDIEPDVFEVLLKYIYTGQVKILSHMVPKLLDAAFDVG